MDIYIHMFELYHILKDHFREATKPVFAKRESFEFKDSQDLFRTLSTDMTGQLSEKDYPTPELINKINEYGLSFDELEESFDVANFKKQDEVWFAIYRLEEENFRRNLNSELQIIAENINVAMEVKSLGDLANASVLIDEARLQLAGIDRELAGYETRTIRPWKKDATYEDKDLDEYRRVRVNVEKVESFLNEQLGVLYKQHPELKNPPPDAGDTNESPE